MAAAIFFDIKLPDALDLFGPSDASRQDTIDAMNDFVDIYLDSHPYEVQHGL